MPQLSFLHRRLALLAALVAVTAGVQAAPAGAASPKRHAEPSSRTVRLLVELRPQSTFRSLGRALAEAGARRERTLRHLGVVVVRVPRRSATALMSRLAHARAVKHVERNRVVLRLT